jgi:hypothetical protein
MKVDFNNCRKQAGLAFNELVDILNDSNCDSHIETDAERIARPLRDLRDMLATILCVYQPGDDDCKCIDMKLSVFAPDEE